MAEIVLYQSPNNQIALEVVFKDETIWLTQEQIAKLFGTKRPAITKHLLNIYKSEELSEDSTRSILEHMGAKGLQKYKTQYYNLDAILSVGYRVNSKNATQFRIWANNVLKEYLLKGYVVNQRIDRIENDIYILKGKVDTIDFQIKTNLPPSEGIFYDGQIFDAWQFVAGLIKEAKHSIVLIDNYIDESVLVLLTKRPANVAAIIYTAKIDNQLKLDLKKHNAQYPPIQIFSFNKAHDRFLIIDKAKVYHIGASLKDLGKKWFAFSNIGIDAKEMINRIKKDINQ